MIYDAPEGARRTRVEGELAAYLSLVHLFGLAPSEMRPSLDAFSEITWEAASSRLRQYLELDPHRHVISCRVSGEGPQAA
jgi:hypothetical protein